MVTLRDAFGKALLELGKQNENVVVLDADLASSTKTTYFAKEFPTRFIQCGIAEQNMVGVAAGLASCGKIPFVTSFAVFVSRRPADQVAISIAYQNLSVKLIGAYTGLFNGKTGASHMAIEDISIMRAIPNMVILDPADAEEMRQAVFAIANYNGPVYLRETRDEWPDIFDSNYKFEIGKSSIVKEGSDATIIASGVMTSESLKAANVLENDGLSVRVVNISTIKPIDAAMIIKCAKETGAIVTAENHNIYGGLGSAVAEVIVENNPVPMQRIGIKDRLTEAGSNQELLDKFEMSADYIKKALFKVIERKKEQ
ncbi:MAG: transketolase family protein [Candidatus Humimicrobiaceae bacterium]